MTANILEVTNLSVEFETFGGTVQAVRGVSFAVEAGKTLAIVGESGCGKSVTVQSVMGIIPMPPGKITSGSAKVKGEEILGLTAIEANRYRGVEIGMIFQDPMTSLNPSMTIGNQIAETLVVHRGKSHSEALAMAIKLLDRTHIPEASKRARQYPFEFSGGMLQRAMIAQSLACNPSLLIADEPTTALDVTIQEQILELLTELQRTEGMSILLITHDLAVVARMADQVAVMYAGQIIERGSLDDIFYRSAHPYTLGLKSAMPSNTGRGDKRLQPIPGSPPDLFSPPQGCGYAARCPQAMQICKRKLPVLTEDPGDSGHLSRCWLQHKDAPDVEELYQPLKLKGTSSAH
ncbi:MAG TPA: ABC transporter ATP-binding protein [Gammaproteobacteria bacterium]|nr:ABC transporter ATP-binding protein [Gammaproteobacteria bacterium]